MVNIPTWRRRIMADLVDAFVVNGRRCRPPSRWLDRSALRAAARSSNQLTTTVGADVSQRRRARRTEGAFVGADVGVAPRVEFGPAPLAVRAHLETHGG